MIIPRQWYLYTVDLEPRVGTKPGKQRPCLAIQPSEFAEAGLKSTVIGGTDGRSAGQFCTALFTAIITNPQI